MTVISENMILLSKNVKEILFNPFCVFQTEKFLPENVYQELYRSFPDVELFARDHGYGKNSLNSTSNPDLFLEFCNNTPIWKEFYQRVSSDAFIKDMTQFLGKAFINARGVKDVRPWKVVNDERNVNQVDQAKYRPVKVQFEFSRLTGEGVIRPHTDAANKILTLLYYFTDSNWQNSFGGGTEFYRPKHFIDNWNWENKVIPFEKLNSFLAVPFTANRLAGFVKSRKSYHAVRPMKIPEGVERKSLNIQFIDLNPVEEVPIIPKMRHKLKQIFQLVTG